MHMQNADSEFASLMRLGAGPKSMLLLHGFPDNAYSWKYLFNYMPQEWTLVAPFNPGVLRENSKGDEAYNLFTYTSHLKRLIEHYRLEKHKLVIVGHDIGGIYAAELAQQLGDDVKLVLINTMSLEHFASRKNNLKQLLKSSYMLPFQLSITNKWLLKKMYSIIKKYGYRMGGCRQSDIPEEHDDKVMSGLAFYRQILQHLLKKDHFSKFIENECLLVWGQREAFLIKPDASEISRYYKNAKLVSTEGGHWPQLSHAQDLAGRIINFVSGGKQHHG